MLRLLLTRRWLSLLGLVIVLVPTFIALGFWQLDRLDQRRDRNAIIDANVDAPPAPLDAVLSPSSQVDRTTEWRQLTATGRYDVGQTLLVRNRTARPNGPPGFHVLVPLVTSDGTAVVVDRGWIPYGEAATDTPIPADPPSGTVSVVGRLRPAQAGGLGNGLPAGQIARVDLPAIAAGITYPIYSGFLELVREDPAPASAPVLLDTPSPSEGPHLAYAVQWHLFAAIAVVGFCYLLLRESREQQPPASPTLIPRQTART